MNQTTKVPKPPVACAACGTPSVYSLSSSDVNRHTTDAVFDFYRCPACDMLFMHPLPEDMRPFYRGGYQQIPDSVDKLREIACHDRYRLEPLLRYKQSGSLLEIGPWMGIFSCNAKDAGFDVTTLEIDVNCVTFMNNVLGIRAIQTADPTATMAGMQDKFDAIAMWHSLEHLDKPWRVVQQAAQRLAPGGILIIAIPNIESYDFKTLKEKWEHLDAPRHLFFYSPRGLSRLCSAFGLETAEIVTDDALSTELSRNAWRKTANSLLSIPYVYKALGYLMLWRAMRASGGHGSGMTAVFRKPLS